MKKLFLIVVLASFITSCKEKKEDKKMEETTTTTPPKAEPETTTLTVAGVPAFSDPEVQKFANDYATFIANYKLGMQDPAKMADLTKNMQEWTTKSHSIAMKLSTTPDEAKKWSEWVIEASKQLMTPMPTK